MKVVLPVSSRSTLLAAMVAATVGLSGCSTTPDAIQKPADVESRTPASSDSGVRTIDTTGMNAGKLPPELTDPKSILSKRSVYFDLDKYDVKAEYQSLVAAHAKFLTNRRDFKMLIQGNTDERGSREYNLALGQKRADALKKALLLQGVKEEQLESVSMGEERPKSEGHDESAWAENRRADMLYSGEF